MREGAMGHRHSFLVVRYIALQCLGHVRMIWYYISQKYIINILYVKLHVSVFMIAGSYYGFLLNAGHVRTACCGHHGTYKDLREAFGGQSASETILFQ